MKNNAVKTTKLGFKLWFSVILFGLIGQIAWIVENMYFAKFMQNSIESEAYATTLMVAFSAIAAFPGRPRRPPGLPPRLPWPAAAIPAAWPAGCLPPWDIKASPARRASGFPPSHIDSSGTFRAPGSR